MRRARHWGETVRGDDGSASLEFITVGVLLLVPLVYLVLATSSLQAASLGVEGAARQASRVFVQAKTLDDAHAAAERAIRVTLADYGLEVEAAEVAIACTPEPAACLTRGGLVTVEVSTVAPLPLVPAVLTLEVPAGVRVSAAATEQVSRFRIGT